MATPFQTVKEMSFLQSKPREELLKRGTELEWFLNPLYEIYSQELINSAPFTELKETSHQFFARYFSAQEDVVQKATWLLKECLENRNKSPLGNEDIKDRFLLFVESVAEEMTVKSHRRRLLDWVYNQRSEIDYRYFQNRLKHYFINQENKYRRLALFIFYMKKSGFSGVLDNINLKLILEYYWGNELSGTELRIFRERHWSNLEIDKKRVNQKNFKTDFDIVIQALRIVKLEEVVKKAKEDT